MQVTEIKQYGTIFNLQILDKSSVMETTLSTEGTSILVSNNMEKIFDKK